MICAEHVIGLGALELGRYHYDRDPGSVAAIQRRFAAIRRKGTLTARGNAPRRLGEVGSQQDWDVLAGDGKYVFLSVGSRYREVREPEICYGFIFDAEQLIRDGALVGPDLLNDYEELAEEIAEEVAATLPPVPDDEMAKFAEQMGITDPEVLAFVQINATDPVYDILRGMKAGDVSVPGVHQALAQWREQAALLQAQKRKRGPEALDVLRAYKGDEQLEILVEGDLDVRSAVATIEHGRVIPRCRLCHRPLRNESSVALGVGPRCRRKAN